MNIKEIEERSGLTRANIRYYEQEGLLAPARRENKYRDYSEEDLETLLRVALLRSLGFSLEEIRRLQSGEADFAAAMQQDDPPFPIAREVIEGYFDPSETPAYIRMADLLEDVYKNPPRDEPMGEGFTPHFNLLKFCALAGVHFLYRRGWEPKKVFAFCPPLANFAQRIYGYVDKAHVTPEQVEAMTARIRPYVK